MNKSPLIFSPDGKEPKVVLAFIETEDGQTCVQAQGTGAELLAALTALGGALSDKAPKGMREIIITVMCESLRNGFESEEGDAE